MFAMQVAINQPRIEQGEDGLELVLAMSRSGDSSTYGVLQVTKPGVEQPLMIMRGVAIYPEVENREVRVRVTPEQAALFNGQLRIEYREMPEDGGGLLAAVDTFIG